MSLDHSQSDPGALLPDDLASNPMVPPLARSPQQDLGELTYRRLVEGIGGDYVIYTHNPEGVITYVSPSIEAALGYSVDEVIGRNWRDFIDEHFVGRDLADRVLAEVADGRDFHKFTVEISHADGSTRLIEIQQRPVLDPDGNYTSMEGIAKDVTEFTRNAEELRRLKDELESRVALRTTELIRANEALRESENRYRTVVDCQTEFIVRWLPGAVYTFVNEAFCKLVHQTPDELIGRCFLHAIHPEELPAFLTAIEALNQDNPISDFENRLVLPNGNVRWTRWTNQMLFDDEGRFIEYQSVGRDITALKEAADTIREKETQLQRMSRLATVGELVAGIAHDVHQPLHAAKTFSEAARRNLELGQPENIETAIDCTKEISNAIARTAKIIRRLRDFTNARGRPFEPLNINEVVFDACNVLAYETRKHNVKLKLALDAQNAIVQGDRIQLEQACINLVMNAFEALCNVTSRERTLRVETQSEHDRIVVRFSDNGSGIAEDDMTKLFDTFFSTKDKGLGMGLPMCKSIAELHGGSVRVLRRDTAGVTVVVRLPLVQPIDSNEAEHDV